MYFDDDKEKVTDKSSDEDIDVGDEDNSVGDEDVDASDGDKGANDEDVVDEKDVAQGKKVTRKKAKTTVEDVSDDDGSDEGDDSETSQEAPTWPKDWREKMARKIAGRDDKRYRKELTRLKRFVDPSAVYGMAREAEAKLTSGRYIRKLDEDATDEDKEAFKKALGVPEKAEDYYKSIDRSIIVGDDEKPVFDDFMMRAHKVNAPPVVVKEIVDWYYEQQEKSAEAQDDFDEQFKIDSTQSLKDEWGASFKRNMNSIETLFVDAPGGTNIADEKSLFARLMSGRTGDGVIIGNDPDMIKFLVRTAYDVNPAASVALEGEQSGKSVDDEIKELETFMKTNKREYFKDTAKQNRLRDLYGIREKLRERNSR